MCRNIHTLYNMDHPATAEDIHAASLQFVRKISGYNTPSKANEAVFMEAVSEIEVASAHLLAALTTAPSAKERKPAAPASALKDAGRARQVG
jgi:hypothetical protein